MASSHGTQRYVTFFQIILCVAATVFLTFPYMTNDFETHPKSKLFDHTHEPQLIDDLPSNTLTWEHFYKYCNKPSWEKVNKVQTQLRCSHLDGTIIHWEGSVSDVEITKVKNMRGDLIKAWLPDFVSNAIACFYGNENQDECQIGEDCEEIKKFLSEEQRCNLDKWNT